MIRTVVVDDDVLTRWGVQHILESSGDIQVSAVCGGIEAEELCLRHRPDVVLVDTNSAGDEESNLIAVLRALPAPPAVAALASSVNDSQIAAALRAGASGVILKESAADELVPATRLLARGGSPLSAQVAEMVLKGYLNADLRSTEQARVGSLTEREHEVLSKLSQGLSNSEIARLLHLSRATVKDHVSAILAKLGTNNRVQAAVLANRSMSAAEHTTGGGATRLSA
ncbi:LuxR C-terminal-related transcriptional regulator [Kitasatospora sp. NPDC101155]|uniref:LuxR C-terminal-related transcriptional regulator n=1 Tax=Kitasatospora sp. NPDC101155 TaxID=3364097 RepID=UPI00381313E7